MTAEQHSNMLIHPLLCVSKNELAHGDWETVALGGWSSHVFHNAE